MDYRLKAELPFRIWLAVSEWPTDWTQFVNPVPQPGSIRLRKLPATSRQDDRGSLS
jgi:hypothetical protein